MSVLRVILCLHIGVFGGFGGLQKHKSSPQPGLLGDWNVSQISVLVMSPEGNLDRPDPQTSEAATHFLYSGDAAKLLPVNCTRRVEIRGMAGEPAVSLHSLVHGAIDTMVHATNFLNLVFQTNDIRESSVKDDIEWYQALVRSIVEGDPRIYKAMLHLDVPTIPSKSHLVLQATKAQNEISLRELSPASDSLANQTWDSEWFTGLKYQRTPYLNKRILNNDLKTLDTPKWSQGDSYLADKSHVKWSSPFLECEDDKLVPRWMMSMSSSFYGLKPDLSPEFKGVIRIDVNLQSVDIDQCSTGDSWFADSHQCDVNSTECTPLKGQGFQLGAYQCVCKEGYYNPNLISTNSFSRQEDKHLSYFSQYAVGEPRRLFQCLPCRDGCGSCVSDASCLTQEDQHLRLAVLSFQAFCMLLVFISMLVVYRFRSNKRIRASGLPLLETILGGSILLYFPVSTEVIGIRLDNLLLAGAGIMVFILYFQPSVFRCVLLRWVRMLGFAIIYGTITLKIYRVLKVFLSRTAQRVPYMTCYRVLKMLSVIVLTVCWFLIAWTVAAWENMHRKIPLVVQSQTPNGQAFNMCQLDRWDYMMASAEFLFLCWGSYLCYTVRTVPSMYHEPRFMGLAIHNEILMSAAFYSVRFTMATTLHPDWMLLLFFAHSHLTVTVALILLFIPKFLHVGAPRRGVIVTEVYEDELDMRCSGSYLNSSITSAWSDHSLDPDDIRDELKKLYAQLEVHKTKKMTTNNPHLQKKRSSRRSLGRSIIKRISEIPESMSRHGSREERGGSIAAGSYLGSYRKKLYESSSSSMRMKDDSNKHRGFSIRKSHSTYDHTRDHRDGHISRTDSSSRDPSLLDSLMRKKLAKKAFQRSTADSLDATPLVYKSASAHNLTVDNNPLHTKAPTLQKSLSVVSCAREKAPTLTKKCEENTMQVGDRVQRKPSVKQAPTNLQPPTVAAQPEEASMMSESARQQAAGAPPQDTARPLLHDGRNKTLVCPRDFGENPNPPPSDPNALKQATYASAKSSSIDSSNPTETRQENRKRIGDLVRKHRSLHQGSIDHTYGWEAKETSTIQCETEVPKEAHPPGANTSLRVGKPAEFARTASIRLGVHKEAPPKAKQTELPSEKMHRVKADGPNGDSKLEKYRRFIKQASTNSAIICPWDVMVEETAIMGTSADQKKGRSLSMCVDALVPFAHGPLKANEANESLKHSKGLGLSLKSLMAVGKTKESKEEKSRKVSEKVKGGTYKEKEKEKITEAVGSTDKSTAADICPWESGETKSKDEKSYPTDKSKVADISPLGKENTGSKREKYMSLLKQASTNSAIICPWDIISEETLRKGLNADQKKGQPLSVCTGVPGSLVHGTMEAKDACDSLQQSKRLALSLKLMMAPEKMWDNENKKRKSLPIDQSEVSGVCPWEVGDTESKDTSLSIDKSKVSGVCPWEVGDTESKDTSLSIDKSKVSDICPWDVGDTESKDTSLPIDKSKVSDICPWDVGDTESKDTSLPIDKSKVSGVCPWEVGDTESKDTSLSIDKSKVSDICPWEVGDTESKDMSLSIDKSKVSDVCPWEVGDTESKDTSLSIDKSKVSDICPWEVGDTESKDTSLPIQQSKVSDVCPWEVGDTESKDTSLPIQQSKVADIGPRKTEASAPGGSQTGAKVKSNLTVADATNQPEYSPDQRRGRSLSVCTGVPGSLVHGTLEAKDVNDPLLQTKRSTLSLKLPMASEKMSDGENKEGKSLPTDKSKDICPSGNGSKDTSLPIDKSKVSDICPWETGDTQSKETSLPIDKSKVTIIYSLETEAPATGESQTGANLISPWDADATNQPEYGPDQRRGRSLSVCTGVPGSLVHGTLEAKDVNDPLPQTKRSTLSLKLPTAPGKMSDGENKERKPLPTDKSKVSDICPWEVGDTQSNDTSPPIDKPKIADVCPWEMGDTQSNDTSLPIEQSKVTIIYSLETEAPATGESQPGTKAESNLTLISPWDAEATNQPENSPDQRRGRSLSVCTGVPGSLVHGTLEAKDVNDSLPQTKRLTLSLKLPTASGKMRDGENKEGKPLPTDKSKDICPSDTGVSAIGGSQMCTKAESDLTSVSPRAVQATKPT